MNPTIRKRLIPGIAIAALLAALYFGWDYAGRVPQRTAPAAPAVAAATGENLPGNPLPTAKSPGGTMTGGPATQLTTVEDGDMLIHEILISGKETPAMARDLSELVKKLNSEAQVNASRHLVNLTTDENYGLIAGYLVDAKMNPDVIEVFFSDLMNRNRALQLPLFMNILRNPAHPQNEQVRNVMTILAGQDFGKDMASWDKWSNEELKRLASGL